MNIEQNPTKRRPAAKRSLIRRCQFPRLFYLKGEAGRAVATPTSCTRCWACRKNQHDDLVGRISAHAIGCAEIQLITLTYDEGRGDEAWVGSKARAIKHIQKFKKRYRKRETDQMKAYNQRAISSPELNQPQIVDPDVSRIKFIDAFEFGSKTKRGHWHLLVLLESHFDIPQHFYNAGSIRDGMAASKRVWDLPQIYGRRTRRRSETKADLGNVYDHRADGNQEFNLWPYGQMRIDSVTHDVQHPSGEKVLKSHLDLSPMIDYTTKYIRKNGITLPDGWDSNQRTWTEDQIDEFLRIPAPRLNRSISRGIGYPFAIAHGLSRAKMGVPLGDLRFKINEITAERKKFSGLRYQNALEKRGLPHHAAQQLVENRREFQMRGAMRRTAFRAFHNLSVEKYGDTASEERSGDGYRRDVFQLESDAHRELMKTHDYKLAYALQPPHLKELGELYEFLPAVDVFETDEKTGQLLCGPGKIRTKYRTISDRLAERRADIARNTRNFRATMKWLDGSSLIDRIEHLVSNLPLDELDTRKRYESLRKSEREVQRAPYEQKVYDEALAECLRNGAATKDHEEAKKWHARYIALEQVSFRDEWEELELPRNTLAHFTMPSNLIWDKVNFSHDFKWPALREDIIRRYCVVDDLDESSRLVDNPSGTRTFLQRRHVPFSYKEEEQRRSEWISHKEYFPESGKKIEARNTTRWYSREVTPDEVRRVKAGERIVVTKHHNDPIFTGSQPLSPNP